MLFLLCALLLVPACGSNGDASSEEDQVAVEGKEQTLAFDAKKWQTMKEGKYLYRDAMLDDMIFHDSIRALSKVEIIELLGEPNRVNENYLYYTIDETRLLAWTMHTKTLVIKYSDADTLEWMKIHE